jgi:hypothetical protein
MNEMNPDHGGSSIQRLERIEGAISDLKDDVVSLKDHVATLQQAEDRRFTDRLLPDRVRALEDQMLQTRIYLAQAKWAVAIAIGAVVTGLINIGLTLVLLEAGHAT